MKSIMNQLTLTEHAQLMEKMARENLSCSRFKIFQTRKRMLRKLGETFAPALLTIGQRKPFKKEGTK